MEAKRRPEGERAEARRRPEGERVEASRRSEEDWAEAGKRPEAGRAEARERGASWEGRHVKEKESCKTGWDPGRKRGKDGYQVRKRPD